MTAPVPVEALSAAPMAFGYASSFTIAEARAPPHLTRCSSACIPRM